ncbi:MAG: hypothetical protein ACYC5J_14630 [Chloroflexota bacterium]
MARVRPSTDPDVAQMVTALAEIGHAGAVEALAPLVGQYSLKRTKDAAIEGLALVGQRSGDARVLSALLRAFVLEDRRVCDAAESALKRAVVGVCDKGGHLQAALALMTGLDNYHAGKVATTMLEEVLLSTRSEHATELGQALATVAPENLVDLLPRLKAERDAKPAADPVHRSLSTILDIVVASLRAQVIDYVSYSDYGPLETMVLLLTGLGDLDDQVAARLGREIPRMRSDCEQEDTSHGGTTYWQFCGGYIGAGEAFLAAYAQRKGNPSGSGQPPSPQYDLLERN